jgi:hypothetical protein
LTNLVTANKDVAITATASGESKVAKLQVLPPAAVITFNPTSVFGGDGTVVRGTLRLTVAAPVGGVTISLASDDPSVTVPKTVTIAARGTTAAIDVTHKSVSAIKNVTVSASSTWASGSGVLVVKPNQVVAVSLSSTTVKGGSATKVTATVTLGTSAGGTVTLGSDSAFATVPASLVVPAGQKTATFTVTHKVVTAIQNAIISASLGGATVSAKLRITP